MLDLHKETVAQPDFPSPQSQQPNGRFLNELGQLNNELINLQRQLAKSNQELKRLNEQKNQFLGMAAHDLRSPLGIITSYSEFLLQQSIGPLTAEQTEFIETIYAISNHMRVIVEDFLDLSTIESGKLRLNKEEVDIVPLIARHLEISQVLASAKAITLHFEHAPALPRIPLDPLKISQVLTNLISNAVKYSPPQSQVHVAATVTEETVQVSVKDAGPGITQADLDHLFQPFARTGILPTGGESSTGLGLAISRKIIQEHNGRIWAESSPGQGSTFYFSLPILPNFKEEQSL